MSGQAAAESWPTSVKIIWGKNNHLKKQVEAVSAHQRCQTIGWEAGSLIFQKDVNSLSAVLVWPQNNLSAEYHKLSIIRMNWF